MLNVDVQTTKIMASSSIASWQIDVKKVEALTDFIFLGSKIMRTVTVATKLKDAWSFEENLSCWHKRWASRGKLTVAFIAISSHSRKMRLSHRPSHCQFVNRISVCSASLHLLIRLGLNNQVEYLAAFYAWKPSPPLPTASPPSPLCVFSVSVYVFLVFNCLMMF